MTVEDIRGVYDVKVQLSKTLHRVETRLNTNTKSAEFQYATNLAFSKIVSLKWRHLICTRFTVLSQTNIHISLQLHPL